jgi:hypothetical protein
MTPAAVLARLDEAGVRLGIRQDGGISLRPIPPPDLLAEARRHRDHLAHLIGLRRALANDVAPQPTSDGDNPSLVLSGLWSQPLVAHISDVRRARPMAMPGLCSTRARTLYRCHGYPGYAP